MGGEREAGLKQKVEFRKNQNARHQRSDGSPESVDSFASRSLPFAPQVVQSMSRRPRSLHSGASANGENEHDERSILNLVADTVVSHSDSIEIRGVS